MPHVFISYLRENHRLVNKLCHYLSRNGINFWLDRNDINPGSLWEDAIRTAISQGDFFIACFSSEYTMRNRAYMNEELTLAVDELRKRSMQTSWFIPVLLSGDIPDRNIGGGRTLRSLQYVDLRQGKWKKGLDEIIRIIRNRYSENEYRINEINRLLLSPYREDKEFAIKQVRTFGDRAVASIPYLVKILENSELNDIGMRISVARTLESFGSNIKHTVPSLIKALKRGDYFVASTLAAIGPDAKAAIPYLLKLLDVPDLHYHTSEKVSVGCSGEVACALRKIGIPKSELPRLYKALKNWDGVVISAFMEIGADFADAVPALIEALSDTDETYQCCTIAQILGSIGPCAKCVAIQSLVKSISECIWKIRYNDSKGYRAAIYTALSRIDPDGTQSTEILIGYLGDKGNSNIIRLLNLIGQRAKAATPLLIKIIDRIQKIETEIAYNHSRDWYGLPESLSSYDELKDQRDVYIAALEALGNIAPPSTEAIPYLIEALRFDVNYDSYDGFRIVSAAVESLGKFGSLAIAAVPVIQEIGSKIVMGQTEKEKMTSSLCYKAIMRIKSNHLQ